jgi:AraC-like DNA-binding protein
VISDHYEFELAVNAHRMQSEFYLMFSGAGKPIGGHKIGTAIYDYYLIHTVTAGEGLFVCNDAPYPCREGDTFCIFPGVPFSYQADKSNPWEYSWAGFSGSGSGELLRLIGVSAERPVASHTTEQAFQYYGMTRRALLENEYPSLTDLECSAYLKLMLIALGKSNPAHIADGAGDRSETERLVKYAARVIKTQYANPIAIESLADSIGYHRVYFSKIFTDYYGKSPKQYLKAVRMEQAELLLMSTALSIEQVAESVGYGDPLYFSKQFQKWSGMPPSEYRRKKRQG